MKHHLFLIYDGIENSVFSSQVLTPFLQILADHPHDRGLLISFEQKKPSNNVIQLIQKQKQIDFVVLHKIPFLGTLSLRYAGYQFNQTLQEYTIASATARGPLAGWILSKSLLASSHAYTIQARGLCAEEYRYQHNKKNSWFTQKYHNLRAYLYEQVERDVYSNCAKKPRITIQAVSFALQYYLIKTYATPQAAMTIARNDIPLKIAPDSIAQWRQNIRNKIKVNPSTYVYVYNGSAKSWQCPEQTVAYFAEQHAKNSMTFLLILTQDQRYFNDACIRYSLEKTAYYITHVPYQKVYHYLAAADAGIIFREPHIINWVSRPTKILEYKAIGLSIIHNNTVEMLTSSGCS